MTKTKTLLLIALIPALLTACTIVPGSHIDGVSNADTSQLESDLEKVNIQVIDSSLIAGQREQQLAQQSLSKNRDAVNTSRYLYKVGIGDLLTIGVWDHPELTIPAAVQRTAEFDGIRVQPDGTISYAYVPNLKVAGRSISQIHKDLVKQLSKVIEKPQVDVKVVGFNSQKTYVTGEVNKPGLQPITEIPLTLIDAINQAGGITDKANWQHVTFTRGNKTEVIKLSDFYTRGDISQNRLLTNGDIIHISRIDDQKVFVLGDVNKGGVVEINRYGVTLAEALATVGGINERTADANGIFVLRKRDFNKDGIIADVYQLHAKNAVSLILANQFELEAQDIVYVTSAPLARWNKVISLLLPSVSAIYNSSRIGN